MIETPLYNPGIIHFLTTLTNPPYPVAIFTNISLTTGIETNVVAQIAVNIILMAAKGNDSFSTLTLTTPTLCADAPILKPRDTGSEILSLLSIRVPIVPPNIPDIITIEVVRDMSACSMLAMAMAKGVVTFLGSTERHTTCLEKLKRRTSHAVPNRPPALATIMESNMGIMFFAAIFLRPYMAIEKDMTAGLRRCMK